MELLAIDFETADFGPDSACAIGLARISGGAVCATAARLIRPPRPDIRFTWLHGISWPDVAGEPRFGELWPEIAPLFEGVDYLLAHNAGFDRRVLQACCAAAGIAPPVIPFACTVRLARAAWRLRPARLPDVCRHLAIDLRHHDAGSDALACARIALAALGEGHRLDGAVLGGTKSLRRRVGTP
jgi:DNA polymerase-3 subunit epsilon